jgi:predicted kinase
MIVELVGLPGVGKSTLAQEMCRQNRNIHLEKTPYFRRATDIPFFMRNSVKNLPRILRIQLSKDGGGLSRRDIVLMVILSGWRQVLIQKNLTNELVLLLDEGPICYLTRLCAWGSEGLRSTAANNWWKGVFLEWASFLDLIIWLDASDETLIERIRSREMWQEVKTMTREQAFKYFEDLRSKQDYVLKKISTQTKTPSFVSINTQINTPDEAWHKITTLFPPIT